MRPIFAVCLLLSPFFTQQQLPDAKELLKQSGEAFIKYRSYQYELELEVDIMMGGNPIHTEATSSVAVITPDKMRVEARGQTGGGTTVVSDGEYTWTFVPLRMQYTRKSAMRSTQATFGNAAVGNPLDPSRTPGPCKTLREESVEIDGKKYSCWVVETTVDRVAQDGGAEITNFVKTMWVDKELKLNRQITVSGMLQGPQVPGSVEMKQKMVMRALKLDLDLPDSLFRFTPPADAREVPDVAGLSPTPDLAGKAAPPLRVTSLAGETFDLGSLKGKTVLLDFWATWCSPCRKEMPTLEKIHQEFKGQGLVVLGLNVGEGREAVEKFLKTTKVGYPVALIRDNDVLPFQVTSLPTYIVIDRDGKVVAYQIGSEGESALRDALAKGGLKANAPK